MTRTYEEAEQEGRRLLPEALRIVAARLESDDMVESTCLRQAAEEIERLRDENEVWVPRPKSGSAATT